VAFSIRHVAPGSARSVSSARTDDGGARGLAGYWLEPVE
jgi:hypothetical protein